MPDQSGRSPAVSGVLIAIFIILVVVALRLGGGLLVPIAVSLFLTLLLGPLVRWLRAHGVPEAIGAGLLTFGTLGLLAAGVGLAAGPAADWVQRSPATLSQVDAKLRRLIRPLRAIQQTAQKVEQVASASEGTPPRTVEVKPPGLLTKVTGGTAKAVGATLAVLFLTYFMLATGQQFRRKLVALPGAPEHQQRMEHALDEIERQTSRYLALTTVISVGVGGATWALLAVLELPNAGLWGLVAGVLNFIPYVGALVTAALVGAAALLAFDRIEPMLIAVGGVFLIHLLAGNMVTPAFLGRKLPLNPVAIFVCLLFWGWVWGVAGAILAVPLTVVFKVICDHVDHLRPVAVLLDQ